MTLLIPFKLLNLMTLTLTLFYLEFFVLQMDEPSKVVGHHIPHLLAFTPSKDEVLLPSLAESLLPPDVLLLTEVLPPDVLLRIFSDAGAWWLPGLGGGAGGGGASYAPWNVCRSWRNALCAEDNDSAIEASGEAASISAAEGPYADFLARAMVRYHSQAVEEALRLAVVAFRFRWQHRGGCSGGGGGGGGHGGLVRVSETLKDRLASMVWRLVHGSSGLQVWRPVRTWPGGCEWKGDRYNTVGGEAVGGRSPADGSASAALMEDPAASVAVHGEAIGAGGQGDAVNQESQGPWTFNIRSDKLQPLYQVGQID